LITEQTIMEAVRRIALGFDPERVILFGSHARGDASPRSDIDLLVLIDRGDVANPRVGEMYRAMHGLKAPVDIVVMTVSEFEEYKELVGTVARPANREGRVLYRRAG
jgi:predicted nucleotidyltransferase